MAEHTLKCWPSEFEAILDGRKRFEWRYDDRSFAVGDTLLLGEWNPVTRYWKRTEVEEGVRYRSIRVTVTYILRGQFHVPAEYVVMGISEPEVVT